MIYRISGSHDDCMLRRCPGYGLPDRLPPMRVHHRCSRAPLLSYELQERSWHLAPYCRPALPRPPSAEAQMLFRSCSRILQEMQALIRLLCGLQPPYISYNMRSGRNDRPQLLLLLVPLSSYFVSFNPYKIRNYVSIMQRHT